MRFDRILACMLAMLLALGPAACCCVWSAVAHGGGMASAPACSVAALADPDACQHSCCLPGPADPAESLAASCCTAAGCGEECGCWFCLDEVAVVADGRPQVQADLSISADLFAGFAPFEPARDVLSVRLGLLARPPSHDGPPPAFAAVGRDWLPWGCIWRC